MWRAKNPKERDPSSLSAYMDQNSLTYDDLNEFLNHPTYAEDLRSATNFYLVNEIPDLLWSLHEKVKTKQKGQDLEALIRLLFSDKYRPNEGGAEDAINISDKLTDEQKEQILKRSLEKKKRNETS